MDKFFINVPTTQGAEDYKTTYVTGTQSVPRDDSRDNQIAFLKATQEIVTRGTIFGGNKTSVDSSKFNIDTSFQYNLKMDDNGVISMVKYKPAEAVGSTNNNTSYTAGGGQKLWGTSYNLYSYTIANNDVSCTVTTYSNPCSVVGLTYNSTYIFGGEATITDGVAFVNGTAVNYSTSATITESRTLSSGTGHADDTALDTKSGTMTQANASTTQSSIAERNFTFYWHEKDTNTIQSVVSKINTKTTSVTAYPQCFIAHTSGQMSLNSTTNMLQSTGDITYTNCDNNTGTKPSTSVSNSKSLVFTQGYHYIAFPHSFGNLKSNWSGYDDTSWEFVETVNIKLHADATQTYAYDIWVYKKNGAIASNVDAGTWKVWWS